MSENEKTEVEEEENLKKEIIQELNQFHQTLPSPYQYDEVLLELLSDVTNLGNYQIPDYQSYMDNGKAIFDFQKKWIQKVPLLLEFYQAQPKPRKFDIQLEVCCLCLESEPSVILEPCGHLLVCVPCIKKLFQTNEKYRAKCPMCRTDIDIAICFKTNEYIDPMGEKSRSYQQPDYYSSSSDSQSLEDSNSSNNNSEDEENIEDGENIENEENENQENNETETEES